MRSLRLLGVLTAVLVVACASVAGLSSAASTALPRATEDRPDEVAGEQVHLVYAIPTDAPDEQLDVNGELNASIARMQAWLAGQTGGPKLRLDTYQGQPDITFVRTSLEPDLDENLNVRQYVERLGFTNPKKLYLMYFGTYEDAFACGKGNIIAAIVFLSARRSSRAVPRLASSTLSRCTRSCTPSERCRTAHRTGSTGTRGRSARHHALLRASNRRERAGHSRARPGP